MTNPASAVAIHRFGLGPRPGERARYDDDPRGALMAQFGPGASSELDAGLPNLSEAVAVARASREKLRAIAENLGPDESIQDAVRRKARMGEGPLGGLPFREGVARLERAIRGEDGFRERMVLFWANWFTMAAVNPPTTALAGLYEREAIRPHVGGRFVDMLKAAVLHPGMLIYLNQAQSAGPNSLAGRVRGMGLNENLAREVLELHTVGAGGGYGQDDVVEFARALTGWTVDLSGRHGPAGAARFEPRMHEPGARTVMGRTYPEGEDQAERILEDLAARPETAARVGRRLAAHILADAPSPAFAIRLERVFLETQGDLSALALAAVEDDAAWDREPRKLRTPYEFVVASLRALDIFPEDDPKVLFGTLEELGQPLFRAPSPEGWPDDVASWSGPDGLKRKIEWANLLANRVMGAGARMNPMMRAEDVLGDRLSADTAFHVGGAEDGVQGLTLFLMSPDMLWR